MMLKYIGFTLGLPCTGGVTLGKLQNHSSLQFLHMSNVGNNYSVFKSWSKDLVPIKNFAQLASCAQRAFSRKPNPTCYGTLPLLP